MVPLTHARACAPSLPLYSPSPSLSPSPSPSLSLYCSLARSLSLPLSPAHVCMHACACPRSPSSRSLSLSLALSRSLSLSLALSCSLSRSLPKGSHINTETVLRRYSYQNTYLVEGVEIHVPRVGPCSVYALCSASLKKISGHFGLGLCISRTDTDSRYIPIYKASNSLLWKQISPSIVIQTWSWRGQPADSARA